MTAVTIQEAQARLPDLIHTLTPGGELVITENNQPVAKLIGQPMPSAGARKRGSAKGKLIVHADDDEHLKDFEEYMP